MFEFDPVKSKSNLRKHGIDFESAQALWLDDGRIEISARSEFEARTAVVGLIGGKYWAAVVTMRDMIIRIISVRKARQNEVELYEKQNN